MLAVTRRGHDFEDIRDGVAASELLAHELHLSLHAAEPGESKKGDAVAVGGGLHLCPACRCRDDELDCRSIRLVRDGYEFRRARFGMKRQSALFRVVRLNPKFAMEGGDKSGRWGIHCEVGQTTILLHCSQC